MSKGQRHSRGFTLIASMLLLLLLSSVAIGLMFLSNGSGHVGHNDLEANVAYYGAESGMEKFTTDLLGLYQSKLSPTQTDLDNLANTSPPSSALVGNITYKEQAFWTDPLPGGQLPKVSNSVIATGPYAGLNAQIVPITLRVSAIRPSGAAVNMTRGVQVALIPVFQFGVFSDSDLSYFPGPFFDFRGRVHTNGNLFLAADSGPLQLDSKVTTAKELVRDRLANDFSNGSSYQGNVLIPNSTGGCSTAGGVANPSCINLGVNQGSWIGGVPPAGSHNPQWYDTPTKIPDSFGGFVTTRAPALLLPFVQGGPLNSSNAQIAIVKRPLSGELVASPVGGSREYNKADIRIMLADSEVGLFPDGVIVDPTGDDVQLSNGAIDNVSGTGVGVNTYFAVANTDCAGTGTTWCDPVDQVKPLSAAAGAAQWPLVNGWLRVEYLDAGGVWHGVTKEWLRLGFGRKAPLAAAAVHPSAILRLQVQADRDGDGNVTQANETALTFGVNTQYAWYPINFFDPREGFPRDQSDPCYVNGVMNAVELDVGNLKAWLATATGVLVDKSPQNGYLVYFSDRRGQTPILPKEGLYGFEDVVNSGDPNGMPDNTLDASTAPSAEDVDQDGVLDIKGAENVGDGFGLDTTNHNPYQAPPVLVTVPPTNACATKGRKNWVSGARHALKLVDAQLGNLPLPGFTVAAENPVYVQGDYNSDAADTVWATGADDPRGHSAAAVIADAVTLLSGSWTDFNSLVAFNSLASRPATTTHYRMAIAGGKNINFPHPAGTGNDFGTDGGVHNFLRYIENWGPATLWYRGSLVSLYYSQYATGTFKCCGYVYSPPTRRYSFDDDFLTPSNLPPGTPMLQDIENLTYWQNFAPCTTQSGGTCTN